MSDLSWLNPTPHVIAVYASRPLSPVATQHSLPSGRYPLLGPDFHRLDRTSLRLAHSLDHLVGAGEQHRRTLQPERLNICDRQQKNDSCGCGPVHDGVFSPKRRRPAAKLSHPKQSLECAATRPAGYAECDPCHLVATAR